MRALNLFNWWQSKNPATPQLTLLNPLVKVLSGGGVDNELIGVCNTYKVHALHNNMVTTVICAALLKRGLYDEVLKVHREAMENGWVTLPSVHDCAVQAIVAKRAPPHQIWAMYKHIVERTGWPLLDFGYVALLKAGISVEQVLSLKYTSVDRLLPSLIDALSLLGRRDEAAGIVSKLLNAKKALHSKTYLWTLSILVRHDFRMEAQTLIKVQSEARGVGVDGALITTLCAKQQNRWGGVKTYELLSLLEGPHRTSLLVQAALVVRCYFPLKLIDKMWEVSVLNFVQK